MHSRFRPSRGGPICVEVAEGACSFSTVINHIRNAVEFATHLPRYNEIIRVLFKYGFSDVLKLVALQQVLGVKDAVLPTHESGLLARPPEERLRLALEELGPTFIKFGQILSARRDLVNDEYYRSCAACTTACRSRPGGSEDFTEIGVTVNRILGVRRQADRGCLDRRSTGRTKGAIVAVKIQRPTSRSSSSATLDHSRSCQIRGEARRHRGAQPGGVVAEFSDTIRELDFTHEASNAERFSKQFEGNDGIHVPAVLRQFTNGRVLTMEFIDGVPVNDAGKLKARDIDPVTLSERISVLIYEQIFTHGFFHADPHPGNMTVLEDGVVGLYDYGMMGAFTPSFRTSVAHLIAGLAEKDHRQVMHSILDMSEEGAVSDPDRMLRDVEEFSDKHLNEPLYQINLGNVLNNLLDLLRRNRLRMRGSFYLGIKALSQVEAIGRDLNPELNFVVLGGPYASKLIENRYHPFHIYTLLKRLGAEAVDFLEDFPHDFRALWNRLRRGQINIPLEHKIDPQGFEPLRTTLDSIANRLTNAILAASVLICSSILILSGIPPHVHEIPLLGLIGLVWGAYMCLRLVLSIWKHGGL